MKEFADIKLPDSDYLISLSALTGKQIKDIQGYLTDPYGETAFQLTRIIFEDGTECDVGGEHDYPYIEDELPGITAKQLTRLQKEGDAKL